MKVYFISGLAADRRVFNNIRLPEGFQMVHLDWIRQHKDESLQSYAYRLAENIDRSEKFALVGLSMGGMIASEIANLYKPAVTILISSVSTCRQFPRRFKLAYHLKLYKILPVQLFKSASVIKRLFAPEQKEDKVILLQLIKDSNPDFIRWALGAILQWKNEQVPEHIWHIHGSKDEILPMRYTRPTHIIPKGTHLLVLSRAAEVNKLLKEILTSSVNIQ